MPSGIPDIDGLWVEVGQWALQLGTALKQPANVASSITSGSAAGYVDGSMVMSPSRTGSSKRNFVPSAAGAQQAVGTQGKSHGQGSGFTVPAGTTQSTNAGGYVPVTGTDLSSNTLSLTCSSPGTVTTGGGAQLYNTQYIGIGDVRVCY